MVKLDLPLPDTPVTQVKVPSGKRGGDALQVVRARAVDGELVAVALAAPCGNRDLAARRRGTRR